MEKMYVAIGNIMERKTKILPICYLSFVYKLVLFGFARSIEKEASCNGIKCIKRKRKGKKLKKKYFRQ